MSNYESLRETGNAVNFPDTQVPSSSAQTSIQSDDVAGRTEAPAKISAFVDEFAALDIGTIAPAFVFDPTWKTG